jgi:uncharacterized protein
MPALNLLIKPASSNCNLRCGYCFYHSLAQNRSTPCYGIMSRETLEVLVKKALAYADGICTFSFQGGEPTLAGLDFYRNLIEFVRKYNHKNLEVRYTIQTNGIAIHDQWCRFFHDNRFLVGISLDGTKDIHDLMRTDRYGKGSYNRVMNAIRLFNKHEVEYNILCVVRNDVARHIRKVYAYFKKKGFTFLQFIPCLDPLGEKPGGYPHSLTTERFTGFLKTAFDLWYGDLMTENKVSIRYFDNLVGMAMGYPPESCGMSGTCIVYQVIEADGGVYPCDFYVFDEWLMGNIHENDFSGLANSAVGRRFVEGSTHVDPECRECQWYGLCRGGCRRDREPVDGSQLLLNRHCAAYREFFSYASDRIFQLARTLSGQ